jgi:hypothetical protein
MVQSLFERVAWTILRRAFQRGAPGTRDPAPGTRGRIRKRQGTNKGRLTVLGPAGGRATIILAVNIRVKYVHMELRH